jgi:hypothetical protein
MTAAGQATDTERDLETSHLALGRLALELYQRGELDEEDPYAHRAAMAQLMSFAAAVAETEQGRQS